MAPTEFLKGYSENFRNIYMKTDNELLRLEGISFDQLDVASMAERYFNEHTADMSIDTNANCNETKSYGNYISEVTKGWLKLQGYYNLYQKIEEMYGVDRANNLMDSVWNGDLYFHDSTAIQVPYCWAYSTHFLLEKGNFWGQLKSFAPKRRRSFIDQVKEVSIEFAQNIAGAIAIGDLFINYAYFIKKEHLDVANPYHRKDIENDFQSLVHTLNKKLRASHQSPFSNLSIFDRPNLEYLFGDLRYPDGSSPDFDLIEEVQKIFCNWFSKGDPNTGLPYRFPVVTLNLRIDKHNNIIDQKAFKYFSSINLENGCFNIYISSGNKIASCCRLINDVDMVGVDSFGNGGVSLGSHRVVTINLARLGKKSKDFSDLQVALRGQLYKARDLLVAHRKILKERIRQKFLPFFNYGLMSIDRLFSTFGVNGIYECMLELGFPITTPKGKQYAHELLDEIKNFCQESTRKYGWSFNVEQVPAESLAVKFAQKDKYIYGMNYSIYSNQFIPLWVKTDIVDRIKLDGEFSRSLTGGGISHLNIGEKLTSVNQMQKLIKYAVACGCEHFAVNYNFCVCLNKHVTVAGPSITCPLCAAPIKEQYTRIIGYWTPVSTWNQGRRIEHTKRVFEKNTEKNVGKENKKRDKIDVTLKNAHLCNI